MQIASIRQAQSQSLPPWLTWTIIIAFISATEGALMLLLPWILPRDSPAILGAVVDSVLLSLVLAPVLWWIVVRPLQRAATLRDQFLADLFAAIEDERRRIARELHDGVGQSLTLLVSGLRSLPENPEPAEIERRGKQLCEVAQRALQDARQLSLGLRPSLLDDLGLAAAVERVVVEVEEHHAVKISVDVRSLSERRLSDTLETALFRIFQEAINNVVKHSHAANAAVRLVREGGAISLCVSDDGCGIDSQWRPGSLDGHLGLVGMSERAVLLGGTLRIDSAAGQGTSVVVRIPEEF